MIDAIKDFFHYRFPNPLNHREQYFQYIARNRCVLAFGLGLILGLVF